MPDIQKVAQACLSSQIDAAGYTPKIRTKKGNGCHALLLKTKISVGQLPFVSGLAIAARDTGALCCAAEFRHSSSTYIQTYCHAHLRQFITDVSPWPKDFFQVSRRVSNKPKPCKNSQSH